jgi:FdhD protein
MQGIEKSDILKVKGNLASPMEDYLAREEPLEIRLLTNSAGRQARHRIAVTMRTPGEDIALALGFLFTEGILQQPEQIAAIHTGRGNRKASRDNVIELEWQAEALPDLQKAERNFYLSSSCGVCGKASIEAVKVCSAYQLPDPSPTFPAALLHTLPALLLKQQTGHDSTGGLHGAALFDAEGRLLLIREDIGRHNALDKLVGAALQEQRLPLSDQLVLVSGRAGFELVQKSLMAGIPLLAAVGAPSSLAVALAEEAGMTLVGFLRDGQFNIYTHPERLIF